MPYADSDGVRLYYEDTGSGVPIVFIHEFGGDYRSWEPQVRFFARRYRCLTYNARGFPPSEVPPDVVDYTYVHAADDIAAVIDAAGVENAHVVGLSMGGFATLHFGLRHPAKARSLMIGGVSYGARKDTRQQFEADTIAFAERFEQRLRQVIDTLKRYGIPVMPIETVTPVGPQVRHVLGQRLRAGRLRHR